MLKDGEEDTINNTKSQNDGIFLIYPNFIFFVIFRPRYDQILAPSLVVYAFSYIVQVFLTRKKKTWTI
jgi:hypothetical protein